MIAAAGGAHEGLCYFTFPNKMTIAMKMEPATKGCVDILAGGQ